MEDDKIFKSREHECLFRRLEIYSNAQKLSEAQGFSTPTSHLNVMILRRDEYE